MSEKKVPTITGLMNSGTTNNVMRNRLPRKGLTIARANRSPRTNSKATVENAMRSVNTIARLAMGSDHTRRKLSSATQSWPGMAKS